MIFVQGVEYWRLVIPWSEYGLCEGTEKESKHSKV